VWFLLGLPVLSIILALIHVTYQFANNIKNNIIELIKPHTNMISFLFSRVKQLQNAGVSADLSALCGGGASQQKIRSMAP
jgi:hypothetical protein